LIFVGVLILYLFNKFNTIPPECVADEEYIRQLKKRQQLEDEQVFKRHIKEQEQLQNRRDLLNAVYKRFPQFGDICYNHDSAMAYNNVINFLFQDTAVHISLIGEYTGLFMSIHSNITKNIFFHIIHSYKDISCIGSRNSFNPILLKTFIRRKNETWN
jgi:hypothetical protein